MADNTGANGRSDGGLAEPVAGARRIGCGSAGITNVSVPRVRCATDVSVSGAVTLLLLALPVLVGYGVAKLSTRALGIVGGVVALFVIAILVLGQMFVF